MRRGWHPPWLVRGVELLSALNVIFAGIAGWGREWVHALVHLIAAAGLWWLAVRLASRRDPRPADGDERPADSEP